MARWLPLFTRHNFSVEYKPGRLNVVADALSRRPDFEPTTRVNRKALPPVAELSVNVPSSSLLDDMRKAYAGDTNLLRLMGHPANTSRKSLSDLAALYRSSSNGYATRNGLLYYTVIASDTPPDDVLAPIIFCVLWCRKFGSEVFPTSNLYIGVVNLTREAGGHRS